MNENHQNDNDDMMGLYESSASGVYIEPVDVSSLQGMVTKSDPMDYFSRGDKPVQQEVIGAPKPQVFNEQSHTPQSNSKNRLLSEAASLLYNASSTVEGADRAYLKEIREAIEELMD